MMKHNAQSLGSSTWTLRVASFSIVLITGLWAFRTEAVEAYVALFGAVTTFLSLFVLPPRLDRLIACTLFALTVLAIGMVRIDVVNDDAPAGEPIFSINPSPNLTSFPISISSENTPILATVTASSTSLSATTIPTSSGLSDVAWQHNPTLPEPRGYPGAVDYTSHVYPGNSQKDWFNGVELFIVETQMLIIAGFEANFAEIGQLGGASDCYLLITRGPMNGKIDLLASGLEIHNVRSSARTFEWAAQKVHDLKLSNTACAQDVDLWVGR